MFILNQYKEASCIIEMMLLTEGLSQHRRLSLYLYATLDWRRESCISFTRCTFSAAADCHRHSSPSL